LDFGLKYLAQIPNPNPQPSTPNSQPPTPNPQFPTPMNIKDLQTKLSQLSFRTKAIGTIVFLSLLPVFGVGALAYVVSYNNLQTTETEAQQFNALSLSDSLSRFIALRGKDVETLATLPMFNNLTISKNTTLQSKEDFLNNYIDRYKIYDSVMFLDLAGNVTVGTKSSLNENHADRDYFQATIKTGKPQISKIETSKSTKKASMYFTAPVRDTITGQTIGIMRARIPLTGLKEIAAPYARNNSEWAIIDKNTNQFVLAEHENDLTRNVNIIEGYQQSKSSADSKLSFSGMDRDASTGNRELISFANVMNGDSFKNLNMSIAIIKDVKFIQQKENAVLIVLIIGMLITGGTTVGLSLLLSNRVTKFVRDMADTIVNSSGAIVDTVQLQEITVNLQANSAIETSTTVNELGAISSQSAEQAEASSNGARQALSLAEEGTKSVQQTLRGMNELQQKVDNIAQQIVNLSEQTGQITIVSDLVADLASQTNMLALNAAVEAARAGEQGKGFSVVAGEIRKLADQSKKSADKINALAEDIQTAINRTVMVTDEGTKTVKEGIDLARETATSFVGVTDAVNNVFLNSQQISTSAKQQAIAIQQVLSSMTMISQGSQESAVGMHQVKMTTRELTQVADELKAAVV
jgi:methyl-accepting chemotaxis protein